MVEVIVKLPEEREKTPSKQKECYALQHKSRRFLLIFFKNRQLRFKHCY